jgi:hypothetical protein
MVATSVIAVLSVVGTLVGIFCLIFLFIYVRMKKDEHDVEKAIAARQASRPPARTNHPIRNAYSPRMNGQRPTSQADEVRMMAERMVDRVRDNGRPDDEARRIQEEWRARMQARVQEQERRDQFQWM